MINGTNENIILLKNENELAAITLEYPYYSPAQFRLLLNYKKNGHSDLEKQTSLTSLFFKNGKWLSWKLAENIIEKKNNENGTPESSAEEGEKLNLSLVIPENKSEEVIAFEPLYTVDYFASQGIKISEAAAAGDKLTTQLKSFTEWLKGMKKIHAEKLTEGDEKTDKIIQHIAEGSNTKISVVTEAMAEVLLNQGKIEQAIEVYNKLSLNYPLGSAYFAAKINSLKQN